MSSVLVQCSLRVVTSNLPGTFIDFCLMKFTNDVLVEELACIVRIKQFGGIA